MNALSAILATLADQQFAVLGLVLSLVVGYVICNAIYNLYFHPLAGFPGPWWAHVSTLHEFYYDVVQGGLYTKVIHQMHEKYGPIVRITPRELHISDATYFHEIYTGPSRLRTKDAEFVKNIPLPTSMVNTINHELHRKRRSYLSNFFSKQSINGIEFLMQEKVDRMVARLKQDCQSGKTVEMYYVSSSLTSDIISHYSYGESFGLLDDPEYSGTSVDGSNSLLKSLHILRFFPFLVVVMKPLPLWLAKLISPELGSIVEFGDYLSARAKQAVASPQALGLSKGTVFEALLSPEIPVHERTTQRLADEAMLVQLAGTDTTSRALTSVVYRLLGNQRTLVKLKAELKTSMPTPDSTIYLKELEKLPYLTAVLSESLRMLYLASRAPRIAPTETLQYKQWTIPAGSVMGASLYLSQHDPAYYPDPYVFRPERWLEAAARGEKLPLFIFGHGARSCLGLNLAWAELYLATAALFRKFDMEAVKGGDVGFDNYREFGFGFSKEGKFGMKVRITGVVEE
ncbi:benzoate 4-monooxygenase cytochrome P450 [Polyplosphaeria fusca]|uniref:Benzoate 4-monooxygenase cytochrome P450 n=1 Tax=Polyplosphaeria fusca TaxID=682080 RepID=A0A9P4QSN8_9PLEO|nr:benzoate 4-monooxygenase cytochrome P450 [Polyplosphaeria fusca]